MIDPLEKAIRLILAKYNPYPPWLSEANWDEDWYHREAARIYEALPGAQSVEAVRQIVYDACEREMPGMLEYARTTDDRVDDRIAVIAITVWNRAHPDQRVPQTIELPDY